MFLLIMKYCGFFFNIYVCGYFCRDLSGNAIKLLSDKAFQKLASLQELDLSFNKLEMVPGIALRLVKNSLANLALDHNGISRISDNAFQSTPGLTEL